MDKSRFLRQTIEHIDIRKIDAAPIVDMMSRMSVSARELARASRLFDEMVRDRACTSILCLAGSLFSFGLKRVVLELVRNNMVDAIVSTGAVIVDQDFFEALGFRHYLGDPRADDVELRRHRIDRIYDTFISEDDLVRCDDTVRSVADALEPGVYSSRQFLGELGRYLDENAKDRESVVLAAYEREVPIFIPAFSDCSAGFALVEHQWARRDRHVSIDSARDFLELTRIKAAARETGLLMIGGGVPKNFAQDCAVGTLPFGVKDRAHKYAIQITVADVRDGALSGSTLREAGSWGKVDEQREQMVYAEASIAFPILAAYAYHKSGWKDRKPQRWARFLDSEPAPKTKSEAVARREP
jgi:deoxyhypusine synthase